jgi:tubulin-specific chaperone E
MHSTELHFPSLSSLSIAGNNLSTFYATTAGSIDLVFPTIKTLIMDSNMFMSLGPLCKAMIPLVPNLTNFSLQHNQISAINHPGSTSEEPFPCYPSITSLNLSHNAITTPATLSFLSQLLPNLTSLRVSGNPFFTPTPGNVSRTEEASFMLTLARLPTLKTLNYSVITDKDRMEGELYYLSVAEKELRTAYGETGSMASDDFRRIQRDWGRYAELCGKYEREHVVDKLGAQTQKSVPVNFSRQYAKQAKKYLPGSLGAQLVTITFHFHSEIATNTTTTTTTTINNKDDDENRTVVLTIPRTLDVYRVKGLLMRKVGREWGLRPLGFSFDLVHKHDEEGGGEEIPDSTRRVGDWLAEELAEFVIRVKPKKEKHDEAGMESTDLEGLIEMAV